MATGIPLIDAPLRWFGLEWDPGIEPAVNYWDTPEGEASWKRIREQMDREMHLWMMEAMKQCIDCGKARATCRNYFGEMVCADCRANHPEGSPHPLAYKPLPFDIAKGG